MKEFQKRNKMSMQFLLLDNERKLVKRLQKVGNNMRGSSMEDDDEDSFGSEMYD